MAEKQCAEELAAELTGREDSPSVYLGEEHRWTYWGERPDVGSTSRPKARSPTTVEPTGVSRRQGSKAIMGTSLTMCTRALSPRPSHGDASAPVPLQDELAVELLRQEGDQLPAQACRLVDVERRRHADPGIGDSQHHRALR